MIAEQTLWNVSGCTRWVKGQRSKLLGPGWRSQGRTTLTRVGMAADLNVQHPVAQLTSVTSVANSVMECEHDVGVKTKRVRHSTGDPSTEGKVRINGLEEHAMSAVYNGGAQLLEMNLPAAPVPG